jgi:hypothetical protein
MRSSITTLAALSALAALLAWGAVGYIVIKTQGDESVVARQFAAAAKGATARNLAVSTHALVLSTVTERSTLMGAIPADIPSIVDVIQATGRNSGANVQIGTASSASVPDGAPSSLSAVEFVVQADGSFANTLQAAQLFENLPIPAKVTDIDFEQITNAGKGVVSHSWRLTIRLQVLTTATISS